MDESHPKLSDFFTDYSTIVNQLAGTLRKVELEYAAALIIKWHHVRGHESWVDFSRANLIEMIEKWGTDPELLKHYRKNPFWRPDPMGLLANDYVSGWGYGEENVTAMGRFTNRFFEAVARTWAERRRLGRIG